MKHMILALSRMLLLSVCLIGTIQAQEFFIPPFTSEPVSFRTAGQQPDYWVSMLKVPEAHAKNRGQKAVVFILDTSGEWDHEDLSSEGNRFAINATPEPPKDGHGHGHMCAGVVSMQYNDVGGVGVAPDALVIPVKVMRNTGAGFSTEIAKGIRMAADADLGEYNSRIRILSMSFGGGAPMPDVEAAILYAISKGCIVTASAGNSGYQEGGDSRGYPARYTFLNSVGAIGKTNQASNFSSGGPDLTCTSYGESMYLPNSQQSYGGYSGTSFSNPAVAGVVALIVTHHYNAFKAAGTASNALAQQFLKTHSMDLGPSGPDPRYGYGLPLATILDKPVPGVPNPPPPAGPPLFRNVRTITTTLPITHTMHWRAGDDPGTAMRQASVTMTVDYTTQLTAPYALDSLNSATAGYWRNRGFVLLPGDDLVEAAFWARFFYENIMRNEKGMPLRVTQITVKDQQGRTATLNNIDRRGSTAQKAVASAKKNGNVFTMGLLKEQLGDKYEE